MTLPFSSAKGLLAYLPSPVLNRPLKSTLQQSLGLFTTMLGRPGYPTGLGLFLASTRPLRFSAN